MVDSYQDLDSNRHGHAPYPSRPSSRLGFNRSELSTCPADAPADSEASQWSHTLFQNVGVSELRLSAIKTIRMDAVLPVCTAISQSADSEGARHLSGESDTPPSACSTDEPAASRKSPSVSRLCFPFVTTPPPRHSKLSPLRPPPRHKYSCFPSLMSPTPASRPFPRYLRHDYRQHGHSRMALQDIKAFWMTRLESRDALNDHQNYDKAYGGISQDSPPSPPPSHRPVASAPAPDIVPMHNTNSESVYPRHGDISALRDPYCADIDRCFSGLPLWTINKTLYMHDLHMATQMRSGGPRTATEEDGYDEDDDEGEVESLSSTQFSDDSDTTLVESENEADFLDTWHFDLKSRERPYGCVSPREGVVGPSSAVASIYQSPSKQFSEQLAARSSQRAESSYMKSQARNRTPEYQWPTNWYQRWELLLGLSRQDGHGNLLCGELTHSAVCPAR